MARKIVVLLGPPGSGKGTQARLVAAHCDLPHISTGDMLRSAVADGSALGQRVQQVMDNGALVSDEIMRQLVARRVAQPDCQEGLLLDGFPRTLRQAKDLDQILPARENRFGVILIQVSADTIRRRLVGRRTCAACGRVFNTFEKPSESGERCDACGGKLVQREDDRQEVVDERLAVYGQQTEPLVVYYERLGLLHSLNGERAVEVVHRDIVQILSAL